MIVSVVPDQDLVSIFLNIVQSITVMDAICMLTGVVLITYFATGFRTTKQSLTNTDENYYSEKAAERWLK